MVSLEQTFGIGLPDTFGSEVFTVGRSCSRCGNCWHPGTARLRRHILRLSWSDILRQEPSGFARALVDRAGALCLLGWASCVCSEAVPPSLAASPSKGNREPAAEGTLLIANHLSNADIVPLPRQCRALSGNQVFSMGDTKFFGGPVSSRVAQFIQVIPVDMVKALQRCNCRPTCSGRKVLCVFPKGDRSRDGKIKDFKKGVAIIAKNRPPAGARRDHRDLRDDAAGPALPGAREGERHLRKAGLSR